jgi:hypothetical protein
MAGPLCTYFHYDAKRYCRRHARAVLEGHPTPTGKTFCCTLHAPVCAIALAGRRSSPPIGIREANR